MLHSLSYQSSVVSQNHTHAGPRCVMHTQGPEDTLNQDAEMDREEEGAKKVRAYFAAPMPLLAAAIVSVCWPHKHPSVQY